MKTKHFLIIFTFLVGGLCNFGQTITPSQTAAFCPETSTLFDVTLPGHATVISVVAQSYSTILQLPYNIEFHESNNTTTFKFRGKFGDINVSQSFLVYWYASEEEHQHTFTFTKVRSFFAVLQPSIVQPSPTSVSILPCTEVTFSVSFPKVKYANSSAPTDTFGVISVYEYSLPIGWKLNNGIPSTGPDDWKTGTNNVSITSDLDHGNNGKVYVRGVNSCAANLIKGPSSYINITRPAPSLTFDYQNPLCTSYTFAANYVPGWVTNSLWESVPSGFVNISNPNSNSTLISKVSDGASGGLKFTISSTNCPSLVYSYNTSQIITHHSDLETGTPVATWPEVYYPPDGYLTYGYNVTYQTTSDDHWAWFRWGYYEGLEGGNLTMVNSSGSTSQAIRISNTEQFNRIYLAAENSCGIGIYNLRVFEFHPPDGDPDVEYARAQPTELPTSFDLLKNEFRILGNPVHDLLTITLPNEVTFGRRLTILDINGRIIKFIDPNTNFLRVDISNLNNGIYYLRFNDNFKVMTLPFIKN